MMSRDWLAPCAAGRQKCENLCCLQTNENNVCLSYYEHQCAGICSSESRLEPIFESCLKDPLNRLAAALAEQGEELEDQ